PRSHPSNAPFPRCARRSRGSLRVDVEDVAGALVARALAPRGVAQAGAVDVELHVVAVRLQKTVPELVVVAGSVLRELQLAGPGSAGVGRRTVVDVPAAIRIPAEGVEAVPVVHPGHADVAVAACDDRGEDVVRAAGGCGQVL